MRWATIALALAVLGVQVELWLGRGNMPQVMSLRAQLVQQQRTNEAAVARNARTAAEVSDLKEGLEMVEEKARAELGMLRPDEIFVQFARTSSSHGGGHAAAPGAQVADTGGSAPRPASAAASTTADARP